MAAPPYRPSVEDVAAELRTRTRGPDVYDPDAPDGGTGSEGTFTAETRPNAAQVEELIDKAVAIMAPRLGSVPESMQDTARGILALRAAMYVERSYFTEEVEDERGPYTALRDELKEALDGYDAARKGDAAGQSPRIGSIRVGTLLTQGG